MAALAVAAGAVSVLALPAGAGEKPAAHTVKLGLFIAGLGQDGCDVEVKPEHAVCQFRSVRRHINGLGGRGEAEVVLDDVTTASADRICSFAITVREPGHEVRTFRRFIRLSTRNTSAASSLKCFLNSPSKLARAEEETRRTR